MCAMQPAYLCRLLVTYNKQSLDTTCALCYIRRKIVDEDDNDKYNDLKLNGIWYKNKNKH